MTSQRKPPGWRRLNKTRGTFETIPSFRVSGKDMHSGNSSTRKPPSPKKPAQYADPTLFPGRRLDRRQPSTYSGISRHSGISGLEQLTLNSAGGSKFRNTAAAAARAGSTAGSTKLSHVSLPSLNRPLQLHEGGKPWGSARQVAREERPLTMLRRQVGEAEEDSKLKARLEHKEREMRRQLQEEARKKQQQQQGRDRDRGRGRMTPLLPNPEPYPPPATTQPRGGLRHLHPYRRLTHTPAVSLTPKTRAGLKLNKILCAFVPDEHANTSEAPVSKQPSLRETSATEDKVNTGHLAAVTDLDAAGDDSRRDSEASPAPYLTQQLLSNHDKSATWSRDDRIIQWLSECYKETTAQYLPIHFPDIKYTFQHL